MLTYVHQEVSLVCGVKQLVNFVQSEGILIPKDLQNVKPVKQVILMVN